MQPSWTKSTAVRSKSGSRQFRVGLEAQKDTIIIPYSSLSKQGREEIYDLLDSILSEDGGIKACGDNPEKYVKAVLNLITAVVILLFVVFVVPSVISYLCLFVIGWIIAMIANPLVRFG